MFELKTTRLDLDDGDYAVLYQEVRHGTQKTVNALTRPFLKYPEGDGPKFILEGEDQKLKVEGLDKVKVEVDLKAINFDAVNDAIITGQVKEWSFGPVDQETLDGLPERIRGRLVKECNLLYGNMGPLAKGGDGN